MSFEMERQIKAILLIAIVAVAEVHHVQRGTHASVDALFRGTSEQANSDSQMIALIAGREHRLYHAARAAGQLKPMAEPCVQELARTSIAPAPAPAFLQASVMRWRSVDRLLYKMFDRAFSASRLRHERDLDRATFGKPSFRRTGQEPTPLPRRDESPASQSPPAALEENRPKLTARTLFVLGAMNCIDCISSTLPIPYVVQAVSGFLGSSPDDPKVPRTVGFLIGVYSVCEVLFSVMWGKISDRFGRKPALLIGLGGSAIAPIFFGLSTNLPMAFAARAFDGFFCGNIGVAKTYLGEVVDATNEARAFSVLAVCFSVGLVIGPFLGGELVYPAKWPMFGKMFKGTIFDKFPYLLPNVVFACFAAVAFAVGAIYLEETLPHSQRQKIRLAAATANTTGSRLQLARPWHALKAVPVDFAQTVIAYCALTGCGTGWVQNFIQVVALPNTNLGFGLGPQEIGALQNVAAAGLFASQIFLYPYLTKAWGYKTVFVVGWAVNQLVTNLFPVYGLMADPKRFHAWRYAPLAFLQLFGQSGLGFCFPTQFVWINQKAKDHNLPLGEVNGWCNTGGALFRSIVSPVMASILSYGLWSGLPGGRYLAIFSNSICLLGTLLLNLAAQSYRPGDAESDPMARLKTLS